ncbi:MAG: TlpA family protein disulfide reductase [Desulfobacterales bacterium]|nr:MAG: TlpA family protein disulfide reductase [Desulfobacterales bacterium]
METKQFNYRAVILVFLGVAAFLALFALNQKELFRKLFELKSPDVGRPAPNFEFPGLDGKIVSLSDYRAKVVLVNIWATWCPPCIEEMPSMQKLYNELSGENFEILAVSIDALGIKAVAPFMKAYNLTFPALIDREGTIQNLYKTTGVPESFIIDREGILIKRIIGPLDWASPEALRYFRNLLKKPLSEKDIISNLREKRSSSRS